MNNNQHLDFTIAAFLHLEDEDGDVGNVRVERRRIRDNSDPFALDATEFKNIFRFTKDSFRVFFEDLKVFLNDRKTVRGISKEIRVLAAVRFFATGAYQRNIGQDFCIGMSQPSLSLCIKEVCTAIIRYDAEKKVVQFPTTSAEIAATKLGFYRKANFPGIVGAVDGTHIHILAPPQNEHSYVCRKGGHSLNVQIVCNADLKIFGINAKFGGVAHDAHVWQSSQLHAHMRCRYANGVRDTWLVGDSGYPQQPWLMTPFRGTNLSTSQQRYNDALVVTRACVEKCIGVLKSRFRCLSRQRVLMYSPVTAGDIVKTCAILHNILHTRGDLVDSEVNAAENIEEVIENSQHTNNEGFSVRDSLVRNYFR